MYAYLKGTIQIKEMTQGPSDRLVIEVGGIGYQLNVSRRTLFDLGEIGEEVLVHTSLCIRENDWTLFGFSTIDERQIFDLLQSVSGIGPKLALSLVGTLGVEDISQAIISEDQRSISQAPGVGAKVAQRIILELKSKIEEWARLRGLSKEDESTRSDVGGEARQILSSLGYTATEINSALKKAKDDGLDNDVEDIVRCCLRFLGATTVS